MFRFLTIVFSTVLLLVIVAVCGILFVFYQYGRGLPDYHQLAHYEPPITTRVYAGDGRLVAEYAVEKRSFVPLPAIAQRVQNAFIAAEDKNFYSHPGVDITGITRAVVVNLRHMGRDRRPVGASTITQQVAKNFLLTNEVSLARKVKEMILAFRIERAFTKSHILELYLNEIYLGYGSYGVAAAATNYFDKSVDELTVAECAFLAALPKAPNNYNPAKNPQAAKDRRDWVVGRMLEDGYITDAEAKEAVTEPVTLRARSETELVKNGDYFIEDIRRDIAAKYGDPALYKGGLSVRSTLDPNLQQVASKVLRQGLVAYDRRHGYRGPVAHVDLANWPQLLPKVPPQKGVEPWEAAVVTAVKDAHAEIAFAGGRFGRIPFKEMQWARKPEDDAKIGPPLRKPADALQPGDVVLVEEMTKADDGTAYPADTYGLRQSPKIEGAVVAIDPHTGRVLAMAGGYSMARSEFNRATQGQRQPGSSFKPFVYLAALDSGYTPSSLVLDAPIVLDQGPGMPKWRPQNYHNDFLGPTTLRVGMEKSRNLMTVRLAAAIGMPKISDYAGRFGVMDNMPKVLAMALGAGETTPLRLTAAYAMLVNGGRKITPTLIDRIQDRTGKTIYRHDDRACEGCLATFFTNQDMPAVPDTREQLTDPISAFQMVNILEGVVQRGTGRIVSEVGKPLAGKTGTSNDSRDTWFVGFSPDLAVGVFVGFDDPLTMGEKETGGSVAAPVFRDFMKLALKDKPATQFRFPPGVRLVRVNPATGKPTEPGDPKAILEAFKPGTGPIGGDVVVLDGEPVTDPSLLGTAGTEGGGLVEPSAPSGMAPPMAPSAPSVMAAPVLGVPQAPQPVAPAAAVPQAGGLY